MTANSLAACVRAVRSLPGIWYLRSEVADALGVSPATVRRLSSRAPSLQPSAVLQRGSVGVSLYDQAAVDALGERLAATASRRGRPRLWDDQQRRRRRALHSAAGYYRRRAALLKARGDLDSARQAESRASVLRAALQASHRGATAEAKDDLRPR